MRIIGGHDYYDGAQAYGQDRDRVFSRHAFGEAAEFRCVDCGIDPIKDERVLLLRDDRRHAWRDEEEVDLDGEKTAFEARSIWFAGRRWNHVVAVSGRMRVARPDVGPFWTIADFESFLASKGMSVSKRDWSWRNLHAGNIGEWFAQTGRDDERQWLADNRLSIAVSVHKPWDGYRGHYWKFDVDGLRALGLARVLPPYEAFQELAMWFGGVIAAPANPMVSIESEKVKLGKHGFDKHSFRKMPQAAS